MKQAEKTIIKTIMSYAGWGIGLASLIIAIYCEFIRKSEPNLEYDVVSSTRFINNNETSANLKIFVDSLDVQKSHLNISAYNIKIENKGTAHIRYDDYDNGLFGLWIQDGFLLESPSLVEASTNHIKLSFPKVDTLINKSFVSIPNLSLDIDDYYTIRVVLLHDANVDPSFLPEGKIVGQKFIAFNSLQSPEPSFWQDVFRGNWLVHVARFFLYLFAISIVSLVIGLFVTKVDSSVNKRKRRKRVDALLEKTQLVPFVCEDYIDNGELAICKVYDFYNKDESEIATKYKKSKGFINSKRALESNNREALLFHNRRYRVFSRMINKGYFELNSEGNLVFNKDAKQSVSAIYSMLLSKGLVKEQENKIQFHDRFFIDPVF